MMNVSMSVSSIMILGIVGSIFTLFLLIIAIARRYRKVGPNEVLVISGLNHIYVDSQGRKHKVGYRLKKGGGAFVWPLLEKAQILSLEIMTLDVNTPEVYTELGVPVFVDGVTQIKIKGDDESIRTAAEQFLSKNKQEIMNVALQTVEGHLRAILGTMTVEDIYKKREAFSINVQEMAATDLANMGLQIVSFTLRDIRDKQEYLSALGKPRIAEVKRDATIAQALADRDSTIRSAGAKQEGETARLQAETKIAEANKNYNLQKQQYESEVESKRAEKDLSYDLQKFKKGQAVKAEEVQIEVVEKEKRIQLQEKEIERKERELVAMVKKPAEADRYRIEQEAEAAKFSAITEAEGHAQAIRQQGLAEAEIIKAKGLAEADAEKAKGLAEAEVIRAKGLAEAEAMMKKADSWQYYNQAAIIQMIVEELPTLAKAFAEPLAKTGSLTIVNTGEGTAASKVPNEIATMLAQLPPIIQTMTGVDLKAFLSKLPEIKPIFKEQKEEKEGQTKTSTE